MQCLICKQSLILSIIPGTRGADGGYLVTFLHLPSLACPAGHERYFAVRNFEYLLAAYLGENKLVAMNNKHDEDLLECPECGRFVDGSKVAYKEFRFEVKLKALEPFQMEFRSLASSCPACGITFSVPRDEDSHSSLGAAIRKAFEGFDLEPPSPKWRLFKRIAARLH